MMKRTKHKKQEAKSKRGSTHTPISYLLRVFPFLSRSGMTTKRSRAADASRVPQRNTNTTLVSGFTLVETIIAIAVLLLAIAGPLTIATRGLTSAAFARDQVTAFYLAQEATEFIRNKRDNNALAGVTWMSGLDECVGQACVIDATEDIDDADAFQSCAVSCPVLKKSPAGLYGYSAGWEDTRFTREVRITAVNSSEISIDVLIRWNSGPISKSFTIRENVLNWQGDPSSG